MSEPGDRRLKFVGIAAGVLALLAAGGGIASRMATRDRLTQVAQAQSLPSVTIVHPARGGGEGGLTLPANLQALNSAPIYARTTGYVRQWLVNIGDPVRRGQVLAILDAPEVEQQLAAARAELLTARANQGLAATTAQRWQTMLAKDAVSRQETDERVAEAAARSAVTQAARANVARLAALSGFTRLRAPFDGVVTTRTAEIGALVVSGTSAAQPLFTVADVSRMRALVRVPQVNSAAMRPGTAVTLRLPEYPGRDFAATLTRTAGAVDPASGTVLVELQAANGDRALKPGAYAQATFPSSSAAGALSLPPSALIVGGGGTRVAVLGRGDRVTLRTVTISRDLGRTVEIGAGLSPTDRIVDSPPDSLESGDAVRVMNPGGGSDAAR
jgi:RND family efflux transporter MFP subunit